MLLESGGDLVIIDPGPLSDQHLSAIVAATGGRSVSSVLVTHGHSDHVLGEPPR